MEVTIRELRTHGGEVVDRVAQGEQVIITRGGKPVAELRPVRQPPLTAKALVSRWSRLPTGGLQAMRAEIEADFDSLRVLRPEDPRTAGIPAGRPRADDQE